MLYQSQGRYGEAEPLYRGFSHERWPGYRLFAEGPPGERGEEGGGGEG